jgi:hypothetical protein
MSDEAVPITDDAKISANEVRSVGQEAVVAEPAQDVEIPIVDATASTDARGDVKVVEGDEESDEEGDEEGDEYEDDDEYEDEEEDGEEAVTETSSARWKAGVAHLIGIGALCLGIGGALAGAMLGIVVSKFPAVRVANAPVVAALAAVPAVRGMGEGDAATDANDDASESAVAQEDNPEDVGDGVMDDLEDGPSVASGRPPRLARVRVPTVAVGAAGAGGVPVRSATQVVTSDNVPEGAAQGYVHGRPMRIDVIRLDSKPVERHTAQAYRRMLDAATHDGIVLHINSGFRTMEHQHALYRAYQRGRGNLAAVPGYSNHQSGHALDLNTSTPGVLRWLERNGRRFGFRRTVPTEPWHWEWW